MDRLASAHPGVAVSAVAGRSYEKRLIKGLCLFPDREKSMILIEAGTSSIKRIHLQIQTFSPRAIDHFSAEENGLARGVSSVILLGVGIHAREWITTSSACWIIHHLLSSGDTNSRRLAERFEWHIFPNVNPDGYEYTFVTVGRVCLLVKSSSHRLAYFKYMARVV